ncbi:hypothetical protein ACQJBY_047187 [Aegilops geniculata]
MSSSSSSGASQNTLNGQVTEKLTRTNYVLWRTQVTPHLRGAGVFGYVDGTTPEPASLHVTKDKDGKESAEPNPLHPIWVREEQQVLGYLLSTLPKEVLIAVTTVTTAHALWTAVAGMFSSQSMSRVNNIRTALINAQKGNQTVAAYFASLGGLADELAAEGKAIQDDELISYITTASTSSTSPSSPPSTHASRRSPSTSSTPCSATSTSAWPSLITRAAVASAPLPMPRCVAVVVDHVAVAPLAQRGDLEDTVVTATAAAATAALVHPAVVAAAVHLGPDQSYLAAKFAVSQGTPRRIAGIVMMKMTRTPKMKKKWLPQLMAPTASTQIGTLIAAPPIILPMSLRRSR